MPDTLPTYDVADATIIKGVCLDVLNACKTTYAIVSDTKFRPGEAVDNAIKLADGWVFAMIRDNVNHRMRPLFYDSVEYDNGAQVKDYTLGSVSVKIGSAYYPGVLQPADVITAYRRDILGLQTYGENEGYYHFDGSYIYFAGTKAKLDILKNFVGVVTLLTPKEYSIAIAHGVLATIMPKDGKFVEAANHFGTTWIEASKIIRTGDQGEKIPAIKMPPY